MRKKRLYILPTVLILIVFCTMSLLSAGCHLIGYKSIEQEAEEELERIEAERKAVEQAAKEEEKQGDTEEEALAEEVEAVIKEKSKSFPNEPITYIGNIENGYPIIATLIVNFKTTEVTGSLGCCGDGINTYVDATITDGKIKLDTLEINTEYKGVAGSKAVEGSEGTEFPINGTITGTITDDLSTFNGEMSSEEGAQKFTATRK